MKYQPFVRIKLSKKKGEINLKLNGLGGKTSKNYKEEFMSRKEWPNKIFVIECYVFVPIRKLVANLKLHAG